MTTSAYSKSLRMYISKMSWTKFVLTNFILLTITSSSTTTIDEEYKLMPDLFKFDDYDKCIYYSTASEPTYCTVTIQLLPKDSSQSNVIWSIIQKVSSDKKNYRHDLLRHGICASWKCENFNETISECLSRIYKSKYGRLGLDAQINQLHCETKKSDYDINTKDIIILMVLIIYVVFVVLASIWLAIYGKKIVKNEDTKISPVEDFLSAFSLSDNIYSIMHKNTPKRTNNYLSVLDGVRFYNSVFLIIAHGAAFIGQTAVSDTKAMEKLTTSLFITTIINLSIAVQVFFFMSTFLTTVNFYSHLRRAQEVTLGDVLRKIVKRYIRFTSAQAVFIALYSSWFIHLSRGPFWEQTVGFNHRQCNEKWWINLLYISNFFFDDGVCLPQMWHLSMDFQLTVIGLLILWWTQKNGKRLLFVSGILLLSQIVWTLLYLGWNNFEFSFLYTPEFLYNLTFTLSKEWQATWITTITNLAALAWGLIFGYMYSHRQNNTFITKRSYCIWWSTIVTVSCLGTILFSAYYKTTDYYSNSRWFAATYGSIEKVLFVFGFGLFIFGMLHGLGGCVKKVLEWAPMHALGKLSFGTYLIQFVFLNLDTGLKRYPLYVMVYLGATDILKYTTLSYLGSILLTSFVLMPMENLANKFL